ncbi:MAG TPA: hypothetical protein VIW68_10120 [Candidatus Sulfotelmatobacter sp.]
MGRVRRRTSTKQRPINGLGTRVHIVVVAFAHVLMYGTVRIRNPFVALG